MTVRARLVILLLAAFVSGCARSSLWQDARAITPSSYRVAPGGTPRSVGRLRKLALGPPRVHVVLPFFEGHSSAERTATAAAELRRYWEGGSQQFLQDWRGYDVIVLSNESQSVRLGLSAQDVQARLDTITEWLPVTKDGDEPPDRVARAVRELTQPLGADGLLLVEGEWKASNISAALMPLTIGGSFFFSSLEGGQRLHAYIFERASGRLVWHSFKAGYTGFERFDSRWFLLPSEVFEPLERAVPAALVGE